MSQAEEDRIRDFELAVLRDLQATPANGGSVLDFGCGRGKLVDSYSNAGYEARGCDFASELSPSHPQLDEIEMPYRLPYVDGTFDLIVSEQVMEHVQDHERAFRELCRILKPGGCTLHVFPSRYAPIEVHTRVPLASIIRHPAWLRLWANAGIRNDFQHGNSAAEVPALNRDFLSQQTNYRTRGQLRAAAQAAGFRDVRFVERHALCHALGRADVLGRVASVPGVASAYSALHSRVMFVR